MKATVLALCLAPSFLFAHDGELATPFKPLHAHDALTGHLHFGYDSRYYIEGRDGLDGDAIATTTLELAYEHFGIGVWYGVSPEQNYDELQLSAAYTNHLGDWEYYFSWTHFQFSTVFPGSEQDNDIGAGISYGELPYDLNLAFDAYYSIGAEGSFMQLSLDRSFELSDQISFGLGGVFGVNQGYVSDGHDGANHLALQSSLDYALNDALSLSLHATYSWALDRKDDVAGDETLIDFFHIGAGIQFEF